MFGKFFSIFFDFLYPKDPITLDLEAMGVDELMAKLTPAKEVDGDIISIWNYADPKVRTLIWELKYRKNERLLTSVAQIVFDILKTELLDRALFDNFKDPLLVPIPMSDKRRLERGYNQTEVLCQAVKKLDTENLFTYSPSVLKKLKHTESQTKTINKKQRTINVQESMEASEGVRNRNVILIDDVTTTGATLGDARRALRSAGAKKIFCLTLAH